MSKVLVIPDSHLKIEVIENGLELAKKLRADKVVLLGDYFDDWGAIDIDYTDMLSYLKDLLRHHTEVIPLMGNHELSYMGYPCSGFNRNMKPIIDSALRLDFRFWMSCSIDGVLYTHAGVTTSWLRENKVLTENDIRYKLGKKNGSDTIDKNIGAREFDRVNWDIFAQVGPARGGSSTVSSPLWADLTELIADQIPNVKQVVGHTPVNEIQCIGNCWFCDTFSNDNISDEYLFVVDGSPKVVHYNEVMDNE